MGTWPKRIEAWEIDGTSPGERPQGKPGKTRHFPLRYGHVIPQIIVHQCGANEERKPVAAPCKVGSMELQALSAIKWLSIIMPARRRSPQGLGCSFSFLAGSVSPLIYLANSQHVLSLTIVRSLEYSAGGKTFRFPRTGALQFLARQFNWSN